MYNEANENCSCYNYNTNEKAFYTTVNRIINFSKRINI